MRGLDYYTRTVFEFTSDALGAQSGVGGGGRYDGLVEQLGGPADARHRLGGRGRADPARGRRSRGAGAARPVDLFVALSLLADAAAAIARCVRAYAPAGAFALLSEARAAGLTAQMELAGRSLKGQLGYANALGARYVAIVRRRR